MAVGLCRGCLIVKRYSVQQERFFSYRELQSGEPVQGSSQNRRKPSSTEMAPCLPLNPRSHRR